MTIWALCHQGKIFNIKGISQEEISEHIPEAIVIQRLFEGDEVNNNMVGTESQVIARIYLNSSSSEGLQEQFMKIQEIAEVKDRHGENLLYLNNVTFNDK